MSWDALLYALKIIPNANACHLQILWGLPSVFDMQCSKPAFQLDEAALCFQKKGLTKWPLIEKGLNCLYMIIQLSPSSLLIHSCSNDHIRRASTLKTIASDTLCDPLTLRFQHLVNFKCLWSFCCVQLYGEYDFFLPVLKQCSCMAVIVGFFFCSSTSCNQAIKHRLVRDCGLQTAGIFDHRKLPRKLLCSAVVRDICFLACS